MTSVKEKYFTLHPKITEQRVIYSPVPAPLTTLFEITSKTQAYLPLKLALFAIQSDSHEI